MKDNIETLKKEIEHLKSLAYKDELTELYNRRGFKEETQKFIGEVLAFKKFAGKRKSVLISNFSIVVFDIDHFKALNDTYGHQAGDEALKFFSGLLSKSIRKIDLAARWGGEEFVLGLVGASREDAAHVAETIRKKIEEATLIFNEKEIRFTASGGVASLDSAGSFDDMFQRADAALYEAKNGGRNKIVQSL